MVGGPVSRVSPFRLFSPYIFLQVVEGVIVILVYKLSLWEKIHGA